MFSGFNVHKLDFGERDLFATAAEEIQEFIQLSHDDNKSTGCCKKQ